MRLFKVPAISLSCMFVLLIGLKNTRMSPSGRPITAVPQRQRAIPTELTISRLSTARPRQLLLLLKCHSHSTWEYMDLCICNYINEDGIL